MDGFETEGLERLGGREMRRFFEGGLAALQRCAAALDGINVFPVPDGDTGTNMAATLAGALRNCPEGELGTVAAALARGALIEARGNSGVILAQIFSGLASVFAGVADTDAEGWAAAWREASRAAWLSVGTPVEGTILTVVRDVAEAAAGTGRPLLDVLRVTADAADAAVARTARLLPVLKQAGVVDAGGLGLALMLRGGLAALTGEPLPAPERLPAPSARTRQVIAAASFPRFCTELILAGVQVERNELEKRLRQLGDSLDLTASTEALHIHIHTDDPEALFAWAATAGTVSHRKVEDMEEQRRGFLASMGPVEIGWVAVAAGAGMLRVFENLPGAAGVVDRPRGEVELSAALVHAPATQILLLANDSDLWPAAEAAAATSSASARPARAVLTSSMPEGIAAALAFDPAASLDENVGAMLEAARGVRTIAVPLEAPEAAEEVIAALGGGFSLITLYHGTGATPEQAGELAAHLRRRFPGIETEVVDGGQPEPPLLLAVE